MIALTKPQFEHPLPLISLITLLFPAAVNAATLKPAGLAAWDDYVAAAKVRMEDRLQPGNVFLWVDEEPDRLAKVRAGEIVVSPVGPHNPKKVPSGLIHDWVGAAFIADATIDDALGVVRDYSRYKELYKPTVVDAKVMSSGETTDRFSMLLINKSVLLKTALDADYESSYVRIDDRRVYSTSRATRVQEIEEYDTPRQHMLPEDEGRGILWRIFSITRYVQRDNGVYIELEVIGLSREIPGSLRWLVEPIVRRVSRASLSTSLQQTERAVRSRVELAKGKPETGGSIAGARDSAH